MRLIDSHHLLRSLFEGLQLQVLALRIESATRCVYNGESGARGHGAIISIVQIATVKVILALAYIDASLNFGRMHTLRYFVRLGPRLL